MGLTAEATKVLVVQQGEQRVAAGQRVKEWAQAILNAAEGFTHWADRRPNVMLRLGGEIRGPMDMTR